MEQEGQRNAFKAAEPTGCDLSQLRPAPSDISPQGLSVEGAGEERNERTEVRRGPFGVRSLRETLDDTGLRNTETDRRRQTQKNRARGPGANPAKAWLGLHLQLDGSFKHRNGLAG